MNELKQNAFLNSASHSPELKQNAFYESVLGRSTGRVVESSYWYFMKIEFDFIISQ